MRQRTHPPIDRLDARVSRVLDQFEESSADRAYDGAIVGFAPCFRCMGEQSWRRRRAVFEQRLVI